MFPFKELDVWKKAINFAKQIILTIDNIDDSRKHYRLFEQIESSAASVAQNMAEGKGKFSKKEFIHYLSLVSGKNQTGFFIAQAARAFTFFLQVKKVNKKPRRYRENPKNKRLLLKSGNSLRSNKPDFLTQKPLIFLTVFL